MPAVSKGEAVDRLVKAVEQARADDLAEIYTELFPDRQAPEAAGPAFARLVKQSVDQIRQGIQAGEIESTWNHRASQRRRTTEDGHEARVRTLVFRLKGRWGFGSFQVRLDAGHEVGTNKTWIENEMIEFPTLGRRYLRDRTGRCDS